MPITTSFPGVYIEELSGMPLSIATGTTAVPAIATADAAFAEAVRINSWLEFTAVTDITEVSQKLHFAVRTYFENGGGYCYLISTDSLLEEVPKYEDITLLVAAGEDITMAASTLCRPGASLFAIFDGPNVEPAEIDMDVIDPTPHGAMYYPWLQANWAATPGMEGEDEDGAALFVDIPPSAAVAGVYCSTDRDRGVWKAPANIALRGGLRPKYKISDTVQGMFNSGKALNMIRQFQASGTLIWGARTLEDSDDWRYVPVRRLFDSVQRDMKRTLQTLVFEPNSQATWERARGAMDNYLRQLWRQGALLGNSEKDAYFVHIGLGTTMTEEDIAQGKMIANIGIAAVRPAEFIILKFTQDMGAA